MSGVIVETVRAFLVVCTTNGCVVIPEQYISMHHCEVFADQIVSERNHLGVEINTTWVCVPRPTLVTQRVLDSEEENYSENRIR